MQIPVATSLNGKDSIPGAHPLSVGVVGSYSRESANRAVNRADLVCFIGSETGGMTTHFWAVPKIGTPAIQIDIEPESLGRNYPLQASVLGDAKAVLAAMLAQCRQGQRGEAHGVGQGDRRAQAASGTPSTSAMLESDAVPIHPARICHELSQHVPDDAIVIVDTGHAGMWMGGMYDLRKPTQSYIRSAGHLGWAFRAGIGAKAACPERPVVVFTGDAGFWYHIGELETAVRWNITRSPCQQQWRRQPVEARLRSRLRRRADRPVARVVDLQADELRQIAEDIGALGIRVEKPSDIAPALAQALAAKRPAVIDVATDIEALAPTRGGVTAPKT